MKWTLSFLFSIFTLVVCYCQSGFWSIPESYISRNGIKAIIYLNSDSAQISRILFTKKGLIKEHAQFVRFNPERDSILQVHAYEYDSADCILAFSSFNYIIGSSDFPLVSNELHNPYYQKDSVKTTRYASAYGYFYNNIESKKRIEYPVLINDSIEEIFDFYGEPVINEIFGKDSIVFRDDFALWSYKYNHGALEGFCVSMKIDQQLQPYKRIWFNQFGLPEKEVVYKDGRTKVFYIIVEKW